MLSVQHNAPLIPNQITLAGSNVNPLTLDLDRLTGKQLRTLIQSKLLPVKEGTFQRIERKLHGRTKLISKGERAFQKKLDELADSTEKGVREVLRLRNQVDVYDASLTHYRKEKTHLEKKLQSNIGSDAKNQIRTQIEALDQRVVYTQTFKKQDMKELAGCKQSLSGSMTKFKKLKKGCKHTGLEDYKAFDKMEKSLKTIDSKLRHIIKFEGWEGHKIQEAKELVRGFDLIHDMFGKGKASPYLNSMRQKAEELKDLILDKDEIDDMSRAEAVTILKRMAQSFQKFPQMERYAQNLTSWITSL